MTDCQVCTASTDSFLCPVCVDRLALHVGEVPSLINELTVNRTGMARTYREAGFHGAERDAELPEDVPVAFLRSPEATSLLGESGSLAHEAAMELTSKAGTIVGTWIGYLALGLRVHPPEAIESFAWLIRHVGWMRGDPRAGECAEDFAWLHRTLTRAIDRSPDRFYAGPCLDVTPWGKCPRDLYARMGGETILCDGYRSVQHSDRGCGARHTIVGRQGWLLREVESALVPLEVLKDALVTLMPATPMPAANTWKSWRQRGRLVPCGRDRLGNHLFRGSDVLALVRDDKPRGGPKRRGAPLPT